MMRRGLAIVAGILIGASACMAAGYYRQLLMLPRAAGGSAPAQNTFALLMHFDEATGSTNFFDSGVSNISFSTMIAGVYATNTPSKFGNCMRLSTATRAGIQSAQNAWFAPGTNDWTVDGWFNLTASEAATNKALQFFGDTWFLSVSKIAANGGNVRIGYRVNTTATLNNRDVTFDWSAVAGEWVHLAVSRYTNTLVVWINGQRQVVSGNNSLSAFAFSGPWTNGLYIGTSGSTDPAPYNDEFAVRDRAVWLGTNFTPPTAAYTGYE